ncbi:2-oxo-4-hydroxy-4-carboxy-5-ureidoimidazoline decarboxylase [Leptolyngbya ohadii]|uniref:2-oxo-4-hydroxy-4-carboxy-5-ureidoimidazoline decarboxylase n=1 Tax=Leptolyngbya ohadii TaxID=1962290 RepID=UPI000B59F991|nr:2-oxo-4-hydroxy-4-carboxy-5-ureidoimidazoline decarboxylase [Leptolyngbya ohadii]
MPYSISELNAFSQEEFVTALGTIFEETPSIAAQTWYDRPFIDREDLCQKLIATMQQMAPGAQLALIRAHPDLGSRVKMAAASAQEQSGAGLDRLSPEEFDRFQTLNNAYKSKFGFPFIVAVRNHTKESILQEFDRRLQNPIGTEQHQALTEISKIAQLRLSDQVL